MKTPLYIVSKGRYETQLTSKSLSSMGIPHFVVVESSERDKYARRATKHAQIIVLDENYKFQYDTFDEYGMTKSTGPGPARNFAWAHSIELGARWHWVMDDNINGFFRFNHNLKTPVSSPRFFEVMSDFCRRYDNVAMAGPNYFMFVSRKEARVPPYVLNTRIYSCNLIRNDVPMRWRGRYNEDTDLSLRMLKAGWCTVQFNALLQYKMPTQQIKGGNTGEFYAEEGTRPKSQMIADMHPDVARVVDRFSRVHHYVDYSPWKNRQLKLRDGLDVPNEINNYGMTLQQRVADGRWVRIDKPAPEARPKYSEGA